MLLWTYLRPLWAGSGSEEERDSTLVALPASCHQVVVSSLSAFLMKKFKLQTSHKPQKPQQHNKQNKRSSNQKPRRVDTAHAAFIMPIGNVTPNLASLPSCFWIRHAESRDRRSRLLFMYLLVVYSVVCPTCGLRRVLVASSDRIANIAVPTFLSSVAGQPQAPVWLASSQGMSDDSSVKQRRFADSCDEKVN